MPKEHYEVINVLPKGYMLGDGTILDKDTEFTSEEFAKVKPIVPDDNPVYQLFKKVNERRMEEMRQRGR
ncbi:BOW99_gp33 family protein [Streptococcus dysgalactiae]|uniref:BOW99_gp33 family protein n=1 Tax=Streptococcus dysgalactiae TaxID=1334 RepID=UPI00194DB2CC|nr:hypothetical protein [Streptococcus dysgalactiae]MBM6548467.1 hypothetical protein [Streptococcus dysgalactiae subsp. equisimilis]